MAEISTIARPYAEALFRVAQQDRAPGAMARWSELVAGMRAVASDPDMQRVISDPRVTGDQVYGVFVGALGGDLDVTAQNFVRTLIENDRLAAMPEIGAQFARLVDADQGSAEAEIASAFPMEAADVAELTSALEKKFAIRLKPVVTVDPSLIGGVRVVVGDRVLDTSVRSRLDQMRAAIVG